MTELEPLFAKMAAAARSHFQARAIHDPLVIGIHTGGVWVAEVLQQHLGLQRQMGKLDISFYRDDFSRIGLHPQVRSSELPEDLDGQHVLLVDDVLYTGRTIRAALNELFDYGRPASVTLAVLAERNGRELPIAAEIVGSHWQLAANEQIKLRGPEPLRLERIQLAAD